MADFDSRNKFGFKHKLLTAGLAALMTLSFVGCGNTPVQTTPPDEKDPPKPPVIIEDPPKPTYSLEEAIADFTAIKTKFENANSLTIEFKSEDDIAYSEIQDGIFKTINSYEGTDIFETTQDGTYRYSDFNRGEWHKYKWEEEDHTAEVARQELNDLLDSVSLTSINEDGVISGTAKFSFSAEDITCSYNKTNNTIVFKTSNQTITIYNLNNTTIKLPTEYTDHTQPKPPVEEFKVEEHLDELVEKLIPSLEVMAKRVIQNAENPILLKTYLSSSKGNVLDTVGCIMSTNNGAYLIYSEIIKKNQNIDLSWQELCEHGIGLSEYTFDTCGIVNKHLDRDEIRYMEGYVNIEISDVFLKSFGDKYKDSLWNGWTFSVGPQTDRHTLKFLTGNEIKTVQLTVKNNSRQLELIPAIIKNYVNSQDSSQYTISEITSEELIPNTIDLSKVITIPQDILKEIEIDR